jgi:CRISPR-associated protein Csm4
MPEIIPFYLSFPCGLHIGDKGRLLENADGSVSSTGIPSDVLWMAILDSWSLCGSVESFMQPFEAQPFDPPFLLSSAFPFAGQVRFYPMPVDLRRLFSPACIQKYGKIALGIRYLSEKLLMKAINGECLDNELFPKDTMEEPFAGAALQDGALWLSQEEINDLPEAMRRSTGKQSSLRFINVWVEQDVARASIDRITSVSTVYYTNRIVFAEACGLWFGVSWRDSKRIVDSNGTTLQQAFETSLGWLQDDGLGGQRSSGYGGFHYKTGESFNLPEPAAGVPSYLLSRYHPRTEELPEALTHPEASYRLVPAGGWMYDNGAPARQLRPVMMVEEGSLICPLSYPAGNLADVTPRESTQNNLSEKVYRFGFALAIGWTGGLPVEQVSTPPR